MKRSRAAEFRYCGSPNAGVTPDESCGSAHVDCFRVVRQMLNLDKAKALDMFQRTAWPSLRSRQCRDALVDHVAEYYELVGEIASAFAAEQRRRGDHVDLLSYQISRISSPVEVGPAAKLLADSPSLEMS